jgi:hypothetical protein
MNRYEIALGKEPPKKPVQRKESELVEEISNGPTQSPQVTEEQRLNIFRDFMQTADDRQRLATSMVEPLRLRLNARSFARRIFNVDRLPNGSLPIYDKGPETTAYVIGEEDENVLAISTGHRVILPIFPVRSVQRIPLTMLREQMRPSRNSRNPFDSIMDGIFQDLVREEETRAIQLLDVTDPDNQRRINIPSIESFNVENLVNAMNGIEVHEFRAAAILMNDQTFITVRPNLPRDVLDINTNRGMIENGIVGTIYGTQISVSTHVPTGQIYVLAEPDHVGVLPERSFQCLSADDPMRREIGFSFMEQIGMGVLDPRGIVKISVS